MKKKGQFFILAAVIIAAVIVSLGLTTNYIRVNREPENFYDFSYEVRKESGVVLDHQIYSDFDDDANLTNFVDLLATDVRDKDPDANLIFIYGNNSEMNIRNYGSEAIGSGGEDIPGGGEESENQIVFLLGGSPITTQVGGTYDQYLDAWVQTILLEGEDNMEIEIRGQLYDFPVSEHKQVIFIMQKDVEDETFITVE